MSPKKSTTKKLSVAEFEAAINKKFGANTIVRASDPSLRITRIPTGILSLDMRLGGGLARGRHNEFYGSYNIGKTYIAYRLIANAQKLGGRAAMLDMEGSFDPAFAARAGVNLDELSMPPRVRTGNRAIDLMEAHILSELYDVIVLDSISALLPKYEEENDMEAGSMGAEQAKLMSKAMRKLTAALRSVEHKPVLYYVNQTREALGVVFGNKAITSGGKAMGFYAGTRVDMVRLETIKKPYKQVDPKTGEVKTVKSAKAHRVLLRIEKDKTGGAYHGQQSTFVFDYENACIDRLEDIIYCGLITGVVRKSGNSFWLQGLGAERKTGRTNFKKYLASLDDEFLEDLEGMIREAGQEGQEDEEVQEDEED